jgi:hypothetical protein
MAKRATTAMAVLNRPDPRYQYYLHHDGVSYACRRARPTFIGGSPRLYGVYARLLFSCSYTPPCLSLTLEGRYTDNVWRSVSRQSSSILAQAEVLYVSSHSEVILVVQLRDNICLSSIFKARTFRDCQLGWVALAVWDNMLRAGEVQAQLESM